jgi:methylated-DNA-protein-cysteine methyltransferase-like protein
MKAQDSYALIWATVRKIPRGRVATYGQIAREAGFPKQPRLAGYALHNTPPGTKLPWHRVINAQGRISFPADSAQYGRQKQLLEEEGVLFLNGRIDLARYQWRRNGEAPVLD